MPSYSDCWHRYGIGIVNLDTTHTWSGVCQFVVDRPQNYLACLCRRTKAPKSRFRGFQGRDTVRFNQILTANCPGLSVTLAVVGQGPVSRLQVIRHDAIHLPLWFPLLLRVIYPLITATASPYDFHFLLGGRTFESYPSG